MIYDNFSAYKLLVSCDPGDTYKDYVEKITEIEIRYTMIFLKEMKSKVLKDVRYNKYLKKASDVSKTSEVFLYTLIYFC